MPDCQLTASVTGCRACYHDLRPGNKERKRKHTFGQSGGSVAEQRCSGLGNVEGEYGFWAKVLVSSSSPSKAPSETECEHEE